MDIFGKNIPILKGKSVRKRDKCVMHEVIHIPCYILDKNKNIVLDSDSCSTNILPFVGTLGQVVEFGTI